MTNPFRDHLLTNILLGCILGTLVGIGLNFHHLIRVLDRLATALEHLSTVLELLTSNPV